MNAQEWLDEGQFHFQKNEIKEAEFCCKKAIKIQPELPIAHLNLANCYLVTGQYQEGWLEYEWRFYHFPEHMVYMSLFKPEKRWGGFSSLDNKKVAIFFEQGFGDAIHFVRFVKEIKKRYNCKVIAVCMNDLYRLFSNLEFIDEVWSKEECFKQNMPEYDYHIPSMSLPHTLNFYDPISEPYIKVHNQMGLAYKDKVRIGIAWTGSQCQRNDARSCGLDLFESLAHLPNIKLISLSKKPVKCNWLVDMSFYLSDFEQTAKLINDLDLVVSVDTAVLHLAGAMGKPALGLLAFSPDFRWGLNSETTHWYPTVKLLRQPAPYDWRSVMANIKNYI